MATILPDFLTRVRPAVDLTIQPVAPTKDVQEALSRLVSGQRVFAEILNALPNGTYRAVVSQREMVLALPFSAKSGDTLELQVVHTDGKVAFATVAPRGDSVTMPAATPAATTTLSPAGQLISQLIGHRGASPEATAPPMQLASGKPILSTPPAIGQAQTMAPALEQALSESGVFYEAHQARWIDGRYPLASLLREPQQQFAALRGAPLPPAGDAAAGPATAAARTSQTLPPVGTSAPAGMAAAPEPPDTLAGAVQLVAGQDARPGNPLGLPKDALPMVQQQLQALESGTYVWHGQVWPGQTIEWEIIDEEASRREQSGAGDDGTWKTRLRLRFPALGAIAAEIRLRGQQLEIHLAASAARPVLESGIAALRTQFDAAGLSLTGVTVKEQDLDAG